MTSKMTDEYSSLPYFHGALLEEDASIILGKEGDYVLQTQMERNRYVLYLSVRKGSHIRRVKIVRLMNGTYHAALNARMFTSISDLVKYYTKNNLNLGNNDTILLKRGVSKGKFALTHKDIRLQNKIGSGAYGTVYKGVLDKTGRQVAVKRITIVGIDGLLDVMKEARVMQYFDHPNIVKFYGYIVDRVPYLLVLELCTDGSLEDRLRNNGSKINAAQRIDYAVQASRGVEYIHNRNCIHRDIATRNCLLCGEVLKLADFGMCRPTQIYKVDLSKPQNVRWLAPEVWQCGLTKFSTDIYAFGIMLWELFEVPYIVPYQNWTAYTVKERVLQGYRLPTPKQMPDSVTMLMKRCWDQDPKRRPVAGDVRRQLEIINHAFNEDVQTGNECSVVSKSESMTNNKSSYCLVTGGVKNKSSLCNNTNNSAYCKPK